MDYLGWNDAIAARYFHPEMDGRRVILSVSKDTIEEVGEEAGLPRDAALGDFIAAVKTGPKWTRYQSLPVWPVCEQAWRAFSGWRDRGLTYPPYIAYLALFVIAAGHAPKQSVASHAYYPRLNDLLGAARDGEYPEFRHMWELWDDLEKWSIDDMGGELGVFEVIVSIAWFHVGRPVSQMILSDQERARLLAIFARAGLDPTMPIADRVLASATRACATDELHLHSRTMALLEQIERGAAGADNTRAAVLVAVLRDELRQWDGTVSTGANAVMGPRTGRATSGTSGNRGERQAVGSIRLCCEIDDITDEVTLIARCRATLPFPEDGLRLEVVSPRVTLTCMEAAPNWSSPLRRVDGIVFPVGTFLRHGTTARATNGWQFTMREGEVRILASGAAEALPDWVEVRQLPTGTPFYLLASEWARPAIETWGNEGCRNFARVPVMDGLPQGWTLYRADAALDDSRIKDRFPSLALPSSVEMRLVGGIGAGKPYQYLAVAPPAIAVDGAPGDAEIQCNGVPIARANPNGLILLPPNVPIGAPVAIEVKKNGERLARERITLVEGLAWPPECDDGWLDSFGRLLVNGAVDEDARVAGAVVTGPIPTLLGNIWEDPAIATVRERDLSRIAAAMQARRRPMTIAEMRCLLEYGGEGKR